MSPTDPETTTSFADVPADDLVNVTVFPFNPDPSRVEAGVKMILYACEPPANDPDASNMIVSNCPGVFTAIFGASASVYVPACPAPSVNVPDSATIPFVPVLL